MHLQRFPGSQARLGSSFTHTQGQCVPKHCPGQWQESYRAHSSIGSHGRLCRLNTAVLQMTSFVCDTSWSCSVHNLPHCLQQPWSLKTRIQMIPSHCPSELYQASCCKLVEPPPRCASPGFPLRSVSCERQEGAAAQLLALFFSEAHSQEPS